ncbi:8-amino-7-oxononanoate synthase [Marinomonas algicola]|uniref:8-amino-7-oxononanoate synthase n=1 Tax=Marinomonas algicola TaxID=2773454 RepID=UPI00174C9B3B|nr:8-amino-7-oxononanoate synthase [Marinomonas algicola]
MFDLPDWMNESLVDRQQANLIRKSVVLDGPQTPHTVIDGKPYVAFCSNDYLGLANHPVLKKSLKCAVDDYGVGSGASHLVVGHSFAHQKLEEDIAQWLGYEKVMLFSAGYMANLGAVTALGHKTREVIGDKLNHASLVDGAKLSESRLRRYVHNDVAGCERLLKNASVGSLLVTDGVFSMDGDMAPLRELAALADQYKALLMVDDAHGIGCMGDSGRGCLGVSSLSSIEVPILMGTFGKAIGTAGAFIATTSDIGEYLTQFARPYIYTTAMSPAVAQVTSASIRLLQSSEGGELRGKLAENIRYFRQKMQAYSLELMPSSTAIQPILVGESSVALTMSEQLKSRGVWCTAIRPPTVPIGLARLRITLSASHSLQDIDMLVYALERSLPNQ